MNPAAIDIAGTAIGGDAPPFVIAELSGNHGGDIGRALALIDAAAEAGADAVKLQTYTADTMTLDHDGTGFRLEGGLWAGRTLHDLYTEAHTPWDWHPRLFERAAQRDLIIFSSPFDATAVDLLEGLGAPAYKIASFEIVDLPLIERVAACGKPVIVSTGLANPEEIGEAVAVLRAAGNHQIVLLHCTSGYPTPLEDSHLRTLPDLARRFGTLVGLSDHTPGTTAPVAAVALGAAVIEKHFTLDRNDGAVDAAFSLEPEAFAAMATACRDAWRALGSVDYAPKPSEGAGRDFRRSLYAVADIAAGACFGTHNVRAIRPGYGLPPKHLKELLGRRAKRVIKRGEPLDWSLVAEAGEDEAATAADDAGQ